MAERFNLTAQLQLQAPTNTGAVITQIRRQLKGIAVDVQVKSNVQTIAKTNKALQNVDKSARSSAKSVGQLNRNLSDAARRFSVITVATGTMLSLARAFKNSVGEAIAFERELVRISQVTGKSVKNLQGLTKEVTRLSTSLGASSKDLLNVSRVLAQAGFSATQTRKALDILAKTSLGATFNSIQDTTEGAIAVLRQFRREAKAAGGDIKFLEQTLDSINAVSKKFAVESGDLITVIRRVGGVFEAAGGNVNELIALFTSVRATTRESAETIATGLRTIFTRIQRTDTIDQLKNLGIILQDSQGRFVGAFEAVKRLSQGLSALDPRDFRFNEIVEQLGGFRQIGKVIPLIRQFTVAQQALNVAQGAAGSVTRDAATAQQSLSVQVQRVREDFDALIRKFADSSTFRSVAGGALELARAFIKVAESLEPMLPLITSLIALKIGRSLAPGLGAIAGIGGGARGRAMGGTVHAFARGGFVPGTGSRDTVPAMLQPGEFVIRKSSAAKLGAETLSAMNQNRYNKGKKVKDTAKFTAFKEGEGKYITNAKAKGAIGAVLRNMGDKDGDSEFDFGGAFLRPVGVAKKVQAQIPGDNILKAVQEKMGGSKTSGAAIKRIMGVSDKFNVPMMLYSGSIPHESRRGFSSGLRNKIGEASKTFVSGLGGGIQYSDKRFRSAYNKANKTQIEGNVFEAAVASGNSAKFNEKRTLANATFDFPQGISGKLSSLLKIKEGIPVDAKRSFNEEAVNSLVKKGFTQFVETASKNAAMKQIFMGAEKDVLFDKKKLAQAAGVSEEEETAARKGKLIAPRRMGRAMGGKIDSVPALLTPGEFVVKKSAAQSIGYGNLNKMNQTGVQRFATGGIVQRFATGGEVPEKGGTIDTAAFKADSKASKFLGQSLVEYGESAISARKIVQNFEKAVEQGVAPTQALADVLDAAESSVNAQDVASRAYTKSLKEKADSPALKGRDEIVRAQIQKEEESVAERAKARPDQEGINNKERQRQAVNIGRAEARFESGPKASVQEQKANAAALQAYTKAIRKGRSHVAALNSAQSAATKAEQEYTKARQKAATKAANIADEEKKKRQASAKKQLTGVEGQQKQSESNRAVLGAAQQMVFLGSAVSATVSQLGLFDEATADAISAGVGMATTFIGLGGTVFDMIEGFKAVKLAAKASALSELAETGANAANTKSEALETAANIASAKSEGLKAGGGMFSKMGGKLATGLSKAAGPLIAIGIVLAVAQGLKTYFSGLAKKERGVGDKIIKGVGETGGNETSQQRFVASRVKSRNLEAQGGQLAGGVVGGAAIGATIGTLIAPGIGTAVGAVLGGAVGGVGAFIAATGSASEMAIKGATGLANAQFQAVKSVNSLSNALKSIDLRGLTGMEKVVEVGKILDTASGALRNVTVTLSQAKADTAAAVAEGKFGLGNIAGTGIGIGRDMTEMEKMDLAAAEQASTSQLEQIQKEIIPQALAGLQQEATRQIQGGASAADVQKTLQPQVDKLATLMNNVGVALKQDMQDTMKQTAQTVADFGVSLVVTEKQNDAVNRAIAATERMRARERQSILETSMALAKLATVDSAIAAFDSGLSSVAGVLAGDFKATGGPDKSIGDIGNVANMGDFRKRVTEMADLLGPAGQRMATSIIGTAEAVDSLKKNLKIGTGGLGDISKDAGLDQIAKSLVDAGVRLEDGLQKDLIDRIKAASTKGKLQQSDLDKIIDDMISSRSREVKAVEQASATLKKATKSYSDAVQKLVDQKNNEIAATQAIVDQQEKAKDLIAQAQGRTRPRENREAARTQKAQIALSGAGAGVRAGDVAGLKARALAAKSAVKLANDLDQAGKSTEESIVKGKDEANQLKVVTNELKRLADQSARSADVMADLEKATAKRQAVEETVKDFTFATNEGRQEMVQQFRALQRVLQTGSINAIPDQMRGAVGGLLDKFADVDLLPGLTGGDISKQLQITELDRLIRMQTGGERGISQQQIDQIFNATTEEQKLTDELRAIATQEANATKVLQQLEEDNTRLLREVLTELKKTLEEQVKKEPVMRESKLLPPVEATTKRMGGVVYASGGASIFKPRGTDTVPAMLTPGEFVIRKSAVDKIGVDTLSALNRGGKVTYRAAGGPVNIMSKERTTDLYFAGLRRHGPRGVTRAYEAADVNPQKKLAPWSPTTTLHKGVMKEYGKLKKIVLANGSRGPDPAAGFLLSMVSLLSKNADLFALASGGSAKIGDKANIDSVETLRNLLQSNMNDMGNSRESLLKFAVPQFFSHINGIYHAIETFLNFRKGAIDTNVATTFTKPKEGLKKLKDRPRVWHPPGGGKPIELDRDNMPVFAAGGHVDSIPAMLTPGEFVMNPQAVRKHGVGFMKNLNQGRIPGFRRGGLVATGNVQYRSNGSSGSEAKTVYRQGDTGVMSLDPTRVQGVLNEFNSQLNSNLTQIISTFSTFNTNITDLISNMQNMTWTHWHEGEMTLALNIANAEGLSTMLGEAIQGKMVTLIDEKIDEYKKSLDKKG